MVENSVNIFFPVNILKQSPALLEPDNTETVWEYYLLENLSCGLLRDSKFSSMEYEGCIADRFYQEDKNSWTFHLRELKWSDGSLVSDFEINSWIESLRNSSKRHIKYLKLADRIVFDNSRRLLKIHFPFETDKAILHELSLADASLVPLNFKEVGWARTVGPYKVKDWNFKANTLLLEANEYSPYYSKKMPQIARLSRSVDSDDRANFFKTIDIDVVPFSSISSPKLADQILPNAPQIFTSHPISIVFFVFNYDNQDARDIQNRIFFSSVISKFRNIVSSTLPAGIPLQPEIEMIPEGFSGRLENYQTIYDSTENGLKKVIVKFPAVYKEFNLLVAQLGQVFLDNGLVLEIDFTDKPDFEKKHFARVTSFLGNQLDASGTWAFLTGPPDGPLSPWMNEFKKEYEKVFLLADFTNRQSNLKALHRTILQRAIAVPLMVGSQRYLLSDRIDATRWNKFDARLRIYELRWK